MQKNYEEYSHTIANLTFEGLRHAFSQFNKDYVPHLHPYEQYFDPHMSQAEKLLKNTATINGKEDFENHQNIYLRVIAIMKSFVLSQEISFIEYLWKAEELKVVEKLLSRIFQLKNKSKQFELLFYLFLRKKREIRIFLKLRDEILMKCSFDKNKNSSVSIHNKSKYAKQSYHVNEIKIDWSLWDYFVGITLCKLDAELIWAISEGKKQILAVEFIKLVLWAMRNDADSPKKKTAINENNPLVTFS